MNDKTEKPPEDGQASLHKFSIDLAIDYWKLMTAKGIAANPEEMKVTSTILDDSGNSRHTVIEIRVRPAKLEELPQKADNENVQGVATVTETGESIPVTITKVENTNEES